MIKVSVMYPKTANSTFDLDYYLKTHIPLVQKKVGAAIKNAAVEQGLAGGAPGEGPAFSVMGHLYFESVDAFQASFGPHAEAILADIPNFSSEMPTIQVSDVVV